MDELIPIVLVVGFVAVISVLGKCSFEAEKLNVEKNAKCYEQTKSEKCWGVQK